MIRVYLLISRRYLGNDVTAEMSFEIAPESPNKFVKKEEPPHNTSLEKEIGVLTLFFNENFINKKNLDDFYKKHKSSIRDIIITMKERLQLNRKDFEKEVESLDDSKYLYEKTLIEIFRIDTSVDIEAQHVYNQMPLHIVGDIVKSALVDEFEKMTCTAQKKMCERNMMNAKTPFYDCEQEPLNSIHKRTCQEEVITNHRFVFLNDQQFRRFKNLFLKNKPFEYVQKLTIRNGISDNDPLFSFVLPNLTVLDVSNNGLDILSDEIVNFKNLTELKLSSNQLETLPGNLAELPNLTHLDLSYNPLSKDALKVVFNIASLTTLDLCNSLINEHEENNELDEENNELDEELDEENNELDEENIELDVNIELDEENIKLEILNISENKLKNVPSWICNLSSLKTLHMHNNQFKELPDNINSLDNLTLLDVSHNELDDSIQNINLPVTLTELDLGNNDEMKNLPQNIEHLTNLKKLDITNITLSIFPKEITLLTNLTKLNVSNNFLRSLPAEINQLTNLTKLNVSKNSLRSLPVEINQLTNLTYLNLSGNYEEISNYVPDSFSQKKCLKIFYN